MNAKIKLLSLCAVFLVASALSAQDITRIAQAKEFTSAPVIDGKLDDECWRNLPALDSFTCVATKSGPASAQTLAYVGYDEKNLYVAFRCFEPKMELFKKLLTERRLFPFDESIEIFIDVDRSQDLYYQFRVDVLDNKDDRLRFDPSWEVPWEAKTALLDNGYSVEAALPFSSLKATFTPESLWGFNVCRQRIIEPPIEYSAWSNTGSSFHSPGKFGVLIFAKYSDFINSYFQKRADLIIKKLERLYKEYPVSTLSLAHLEDDAKKIITNYLEKAHNGKIETEEQALSLFKEGQSALNELEKILSELQLEIIKNEFK